MDASDNGPEPHRLPRLVTGVLLVAPLALAGLGATAASASASNGGSPATVRTVGTAADADVSASICANCHQTLSHVAPL
jgi:cytochrome c553